MSFLIGIAAIGALVCLGMLALTLAAGDRA